MHELLTVPAADYHADPCERPSLSQSMAHTLLSKSPQHAYRSHPKLGGIGRTATRSMDRGTVIHEMLLNGGELEGVGTVAYDSYRTNAAKAERDFILSCGMIPVLIDELQELRTAASAIRLRLSEMGVNLSGQAEGVAIWTERADDGSEVLCRARLDHWHAPQIDDLKTCASAHPKMIVRSIFEHGYELQACAYLSAIEHLFPDLAGRVRFRFLFCELDEPYHVTPVELDGSMMAIGRSKWRRAVNLWAECLRTGIWPGYVSGTYRATAPIWQIKDELEQSNSTVELASYLD